MSTIGDGATYAPQSKSKNSRVVEAGEFTFAAAFLDHGHIYGQVQGLLEAGATLCGVYEPRKQKREAFLRQFGREGATKRCGELKVFSSFDELLDDAGVQLIAAAAVPSQRGAIGVQVMSAGKDYFTDKSPFTTLEQLQLAKKVNAETQQKYWVYYAERLHNEAAWHAGELIKQGVIGDVLHVANLAPHRLAKDTRPEWFFHKESYGGIITDIGSHQVEQFLTYSGATQASVSHARVANLANSDRPELEDFGEFSLLGAANSTGLAPSFFSRVDWFTPEGSPVWGDGRSFITGSKGTLELRKYIDPGKQSPASQIILTNHESIETIDCLNKTGFPFFGQMILDCLNRTEKAMTQEHIFLAAELSMQAQELADAANS